MVRFTRHPRLLILTALALVACAVAAMPSVAHATVQYEIDANTSPTNTLRTSPPRMELDVTPGKSTVQQVSITNDSPNPQDVTVTPKDFAASSDPHQIGNAVEDGEYGAGDWITPEITDFRLKAFQRITFDVTIDPPLSAPPGTNLGALQVRGVPASGKIGAEDGGGGGVIVDALVEVFLTVAGPVKHDLSITAVATHDAYQFGSNRLVSWDVSFKNNGTVNEHVEGALDVQSIFGNRADRIKIEPQLVLRGSSRTIRVIWRNVPWVGAFTPKVDVRGDDAKEQFRTGTRTVILPWWVFPLIFLMVFAPIVWLWLSRRREWKRYVNDGDDDDDFDDDWDPTMTGPV